MKLIVGGGYGEHGRNCFLVRTDSLTFIVDCGIIIGQAQPYPKLTDSEIREAHWLFITHSHQDHVGAYPWLVERGFSGTVVMTKETLRQTGLSPEKLLIIDGLTPALTPYILEEDFSVQWGKSGHCAGSVWYFFEKDEHSILFSGDYIEDTFIYRCDPLRNIQADIAVLDSAYGTKKYSAMDYRAKLLNQVKNIYEKGRKILFPVPRFGRGLELVLLLHQHFPKARFALDDRIMEQLIHIKSLSYWIKVELFDIGHLVQKTLPIERRAEADFIFICDSQLKTSSSQYLALELNRKEDIIMLTGHVYPNTFSEKFLKNEYALFSRYAVHMSNLERLQLEQKNHFSKVLPYHWQ